MESDVATDLEREFSESEIKKALDSLASDKSPGSEDFPMDFYKRAWKFLKPKIIAIVQEL